ncbi:MAG TPA: hypothetical protein VE826_14425 [Dongiaceae bacterium]|nr:hypothetical protein [Dongiaceae bacterium]
MADLVFGPHVTGYSALGIGIGLTTSVFCDTSTGAAVPESLTVTLSTPAGATAQITSVADGQTAALAVTPGISVTATVDNCRTVRASDTAPELFAFQLVLRASGSVKVGFFRIPISAQIDAFDVTIAADPATHAAILRDASQA